MDAGLEATTHFATWNVAGVKEDEFDDLVAQISDNYAWDVLFYKKHLGVQKAWPWGADTCCSRVLCS